ncbi:MAG: hypothetical protein HUJ91_07665, partial [Bacteroidales bacterium]|nr:hypothetical protein [Bacteroidales bacterium]
MKKTLVALCAVLLISGCSTDKEATQSAFDFKEFLDPGASYRSAPFYSLNDSLSADELTRQIGLMKQGGFGGVFLHSRTGLLTPYLSDEWFKMMDAGVKACQDNGMEAWFYDEDKWPSGFAGGIIPRMNDAFRACTMGRMPLDYELTSDDTLLLEDGRYKYVAQRDAMEQSWYNGTCWVDLMNPAMVDAFIECSYRPYVERYSGMKGVKGIFTDEPQISARPMPGSDGRISYSPVMDSVFTAMWGYDLKEAIPGLFEEVGQWRKARLHYYRTIARCMDEAFSNRIGSYCSENGLIWTGHYNAEQSPRGSMQNEGDLMLQLRRMQAPGMDALGLRLEDIHNDKVCSSVANQYGITRRLCEVFGISGHNMDFEDRMWLTAYHTIMGINFMCPHLYLYSMKGERKRDFPPTLSHQQPYWAFNKLFEDFSGRLCYVASVGKPVGDVCVLTPQETYYLAEPPVGLDRASFKDW